MSRKKPAVLSKQPITSKAAANATGTTHCIQKKEGAGSAIAAAPAIVDTALSSSAGKPMDSSTQAFMESRFQYDFSNVKVHTGNLAAKSADAINALAYTSGNNIVFNSGQYDVHNQPGLRLLAHELSHVIQQNNQFTTDKIAREVDEEEKPVYPPDWQHGAPTKPVPPDPHVLPPPKPPDQGPYRDPAPMPEESTREKIAAALKRAGVPAWAVAGLIVLIIAALADPEPFSKVVLLIGTAAAVIFFIAIGRGSDVPSTATASAESGESEEEYA